LVLAGAGSGGGKTLITAGVIAAFRERGMRVKPFKVGPDFVDAAYLARVAQEPCRNLDPWILGADAILQSFHRGCSEADVAVVEGMLGLHDSWGSAMEGSTAELSKTIKAPVLLILDVKDTIQSAAAVALGFKNVDPAVRIAGVILNRVENEDQGRWIEEAVWRLAKVPVLGSIPELAELRQGVAGSEIEAKTLREVMERYIDLNLLRRIAGRAQALTVPAPALVRPIGAPVRLGVAYDDAFRLYYPENLELLSEAGAEIVPFSLLLDHNVPRVDGIYIAGGSTERFAAGLALNTRMLESVREAHEEGTPIYAECGGLMYLAELVINPDGRRHRMAGLLPLTIEAAGDVKHLGYREATTMQDCVLAPKGESLRGHEYHWTRITARESTQPAYELSDANGYRIGHEGYARPGILASNIHVHFGQKPELAMRFLEACSHRAGNRVLMA
jgi:cobyrinic acid a,c-diamide synthase